MTQAISTRFVGPGNVRGSRIIAKAFAGKVTIGYDHRLSGDANHAAAAKALADKFGWRGTWVAGGEHSGNGNVYVNLGRDIEINTCLPGVQIAFVTLGTPED